MPYVSKKEIEKAREMDLLTYLERFEPEKLVDLGGGVYCTREHDSLKISNGKWSWWSRGTGGHTALDYLVVVEGMTLPEAVCAINGTAYTHQWREGKCTYDPHPPKVGTPPNPFPFHLPARKTGEYLPICAHGESTRRSSITVSGTAFSMRRRSTTTRFSWGTTWRACPDTPPCGAHCPAPPFCKMWRAVINGIAFL